MLKCKDPRRVNSNYYMLCFQYIGVNISNLTVMLLNTMVPDCLVHVDCQSIDLDITSVDRW